MNKLDIKFFPIISSVFILTLHILGYFAALYLSNYSAFIVWILAAYIDIIFMLKLGKITRSFHESMHVDTLTQLNNRDFFYANIAAQMEKMEKEKSNISLLIIDLDNFKTINDTYGHMAGDEILKQFSNVIKNNIRDTDIATRWGGDEFVITLHGVDTKEAFHIADRIRREIDNYDFSFNNIFIKVTASIGISSIEDKIDINSFVELADKALYKAKVNKNSVAFLNDYQDFIVDKKKSA